jgi:transposase
VIRSGATSFHYARGTQPAPKLGPWRDALDGLLLTNAGKSARERLTLMRLFEALRGLGYEGGYDAVRRYARTWRRERSAMTADAYVPLSFAPGEAYQFDWSHEVVLIDGVTVKIKVAHVRLCHSRMPFVRAYPRESQEMVFDAHDRAFAFFKGACQRGIYDNMKTAGLQSALPADVQPLPRRPGRVHARLGLGERTGREPGRARARAVLHPTGAGEEL